MLTLNTQGQHQTGEFWVSSHCVKRRGMNQSSYSFMTWRGISQNNDRGIPLIFAIIAVEWIYFNHNKSFSLHRDMYNRFCLWNRLMTKPSMTSVLNLNFQLSYSYVCQVLQKFKSDYCHRKHWDQNNVFLVFSLDSTQNDENTQPINLSKSYAEQVKLFKKKLQPFFLRQVNPQISCIKDLLRSIFRYLLIKQSLKPKRKFWVILHHIEQWCNEVDLFALKLTFV